MSVLIIGSTGFRPGMVLSEYVPVLVPFMGKSGRYYEGHVGREHVYFMARNFEIGAVRPDLLDREEAFKIVGDMGVRYIVATCIVGSLVGTAEVGEVVVLDQFIDWTRGRVGSGSRAGGHFVDFTNPFSEEVRKALICGCSASGIKFREKGCYVCVDGPRFETAAEVRAFRILGGDVVGMTLVPEVVWARELGYRYAAIGVVANFAAGLAPTVEIGAVNRETLKRVEVVSEVLRRTCLVLGGAE